MFNLFGGAAQPNKGPAQQPQQRKPAGPVGGGSTIPYGQSSAPGGAGGRPSSGGNAAFGTVSTNYTPASGNATRSGSGAGLPSAGGADLFGSLSLKASDSTAPAASGSPFSGLNVAAPASNTAAPAATGFGFLSSAAPAAAPAATGFDFLGSSGATSSAPAPAPAAPSGFSFASPSAAVPAAAATPAPAASAIPVDASHDGAGIRKKKGGFRPGFDRSGLAAGGEGGAGAGGHPPGSMLSGLTVHEGGAEGDGGNEPSGLLAGMQVHGGEDDTGGGEGILSGMMVHGGAGGGEASSSAVDGSSLFARLAGATPSAAEAPVASGFPSLISKSSAATSTIASATPAISSSEGAGPWGAAAVTTASASSSSSSSASSLDPVTRKKGHISALHEAAQSTRLRLADVKIRLRALGDEDRAAQVEVDKVRAKLGEVEAAQDEAVRSEAFEDAERLSQQLDSLKGSLAVAENKRQTVLDRKARAEEEQEAALQEHMAVTNECLTGLQGYESDRTVALSSFLREALTKHSVGMERIKGEEEQLRLKQEHVARESVLVGEEEQQVERAISEQTEELNRTVTELREKHVRLTDEVAELERLLEAKKREQRTAASQLTDAEAKIAGIRAKFDKQTKRLQAKRGAVEEEKRECESESQAIAKAKREYAAAKAKDRAAERALIRQTGYAKLDVSTLEELRAALLVQEGKRRALAAQSSAAGSQVAVAMAQVDKATKAVRSVAARKAALEGQVNAARKVIAGIDGKIPALNEEKKAAVSAKRFKEAARANEDLKRLDEQRGQAEKEIAEATSGIDTADQEAVTTQAEMDKAIARLEEVRKETDLARMQLLTDAAKTVMLALRGVSKRLPVLPVTPLCKVAQVDATSLEVLPEQDDTADPQDEELGVEIEPKSRQSAAQAAAVELLSAQRDALVEELKGIAGRHGVPVDLTLPPAPTAAEEEEEAGLVAGAEGVGAAAQPVEAPETITHPPLGAMGGGILAGLTAPQETTEGEGTPVPVAAGFEALLGTASPSAPAVSGLPFLVEGEGATPGANTTTASSSVLLLAGSAVAGTAEAEVPVSGFSSIFGGALASTAEAGAAAEVSALPFLSSSAMEAGPGAGAGVGMEGEGGQAAPKPPSLEAIAAARTLKMKKAAQALLSIAAAVSEKEGQISEAVERDDFDVADTIQADIDSMLAYRSSLLTATATALGLPLGEGEGTTEEYVLGHAEVEVDEELAGSVPEGFDFTAPAPVQEAPAASALPFSLLSAVQVPAGADGEVPVEASGAGSPAVTGFNFM